MSMRAIVSQLNDKEHPIYLCFLSSDVPLKKNRKDGRHRERRRYIGSIVSVDDTTRYLHLQTARQILLHVKHDPWYTQQDVGLGQDARHFTRLAQLLETLNLPRIIVPVIWAISSHTQQKGVTSR